MSNSLSDKEISLIKGIMQYHPELNNQTILNRFSVAERTINGGRISEIRNKQRHANVAVASESEVDKFINGKTTVYHYLEQLPMGEDMFLFGDIKYSPASMKVLTNEGKNVEFKKIYETSKIPVYLKTLVAMANTGVQCGKIIFGVRNDGQIIGCEDNIDIEQWGNLSYHYFTPYLNIKDTTDVCGDIRLVSIQFNDHEACDLPIICMKNFNIQKPKPESIMHDGQIFYRYGPQTKPISHTDLKQIIADRIQLAIKQNI